MSSFDQDSSIEKGEMGTVIMNDRSRITFEPEDRLERRRRHSRQRSMSRDSISSIRSRAQSTSAATGLPIEFRTLSFNVSHSQTVNEVVSESKWRPKRKAATKKTKTPFKKEAKVEDKRMNDAEHFEKLDFHILDANSVVNGLSSSSELGLTSEYASTRLATDGKNMLPRRRQNYAKKLFEYVFGGFCSVLWVGVIIFFICWYVSLSHTARQLY
jgi:sodium/potassium-transporting ATPase subunit alpha